MTARIEDAGDRLIIWNGNAARRGALGPELYAAIRTAMEQAVHPRIRAIILTSDGDFFCAGGDLNVLIERRSLSEAERRAKVDDLHDLIRAMRESPVPIIGAIKGGAAGAGASLALACDLIVAEAGAKFTAAYVKAGLVPDAGLTASLARLVPRTLAMEMCILARPVTSERLLALGAITDCVAGPDVLTRAHQLADEVARGPRDAIGAIRSLVASAYDQTEAVQLDLERDAMARAAGGAESAEGIAAFLEKRPARFD
ncbi:oxepin-CoA hydrolase, alternative type [uncultured Tateyamaria sp.]|uniref:oxepin-CoA hydrolase, alternative type n=1 Tax=uncultured Tateyamaria sp. TaxID=455651 RepID=UPI00263060A5|nr:enoyl-CoA hydratase family protein [uncultured Tateyamaria sp.]